MNRRATEPLSEVDPNSHANPDEALVTYISLDWDVDFGKCILKGSVDLTVEKQIEEAEKLILDVKDLTITSITDKESEEPLEYTISEPYEVFGSGLEIKLPKTIAKILTISICYETSPSASALQWLSRRKTVGRRYPYLFSQCQAIHCRSIVPCQDTPSVKCGYEARVSCIKPIMVLMSGICLDIIDDPDNPKRQIISFVQRVPIPSYLIAIVAGDIVSRDIGPRTKVWSEAEYVDKAAFEFAETEVMLKHAEQLMGPYVWGRYDLLVLPPSFPYGGMENPCLTFVTPTVLAGDRSQADVISHELAHSWTGNLVTNKTCADFWLNEGHTMFLERKILAARRGGEPFRHFSAIQGWEALEYCVDVYGPTHPYTKLVPDMSGTDPDEAFSSVPYEKGHTLLYYIETLVGGVEPMEGYLRAYIEKFKYKSLNTDEWKEFIIDYFQEQGQDGVFDQVDWDEWFYGVGMPPVKPDYNTALRKKCEALAERWIDADDNNLSEFTESDLSSLNALQVVEFFSIILNHKETLSIIKLQTMDKLYKMIETKNCEVRVKWLRLGLKCRWEEIIPRAIKFINEQGRMKFVEPIYRDLYEWDKSTDLAVANFQKEESHMHTITANLIAKALELMEPQSQVLDLLNEEDNDED